VVGRADWPNFEVSDLCHVPEYCISCAIKKMVYSVPPAFLKCGDLRWLTGRAVAFGSRIWVKAGQSAGLSPVPAGAHLDNAVLVEGEHEVVAVVPRLDAQPVQAGLVDHYQHGVPAGHHLFQFGGQALVPARAD
jgi:hypothetical protein